MAFYFGNDGTLIKSIATNQGPFLLTASAHGTTLTTQMPSFMTFITYNPDGSVASEADNGIIFNFIVPGGGSVLLDVGRVVFDGEGNPIFVAGPHQADSATSLSSARRSARGRREVEERSLRANRNRYSAVLIGPRPRASRGARAPPRYRVPDGGKGKARVRTIVTADHTEGDLGEALAVFGRVGAELGLR